jgi:hypothetical protein
MSLEKWAEYNWLRREPTTSDEIQGLLSIVERGLRDAEVTSISTDLRFVAAFNSALAAATVVLRARGYRTASQAGHHVRTIESLEFSIPDGRKFVQRLKVLNSKRKPNQL